MAKEAPQENNASAAKAAPSGNGGWMPVIAVLVLVPALSFAMAEFVLFPRLEKRLAAAGASAEQGAHGAAEKGHAEEGKDAHGKNLEPTFSYQFQDIVSNLAGAMKSRYIKVSFTAYSTNPQFEHVVTANKAKMLDTALSVLSSLALSDLEDPGVKNKVRNELVFAFETVLRGRVVEEVYFSEFVIQ